MSDETFNIGMSWLCRDMPGTMSYYEQLTEDGHDLSYAQVVHGLRAWCKAQGYDSITEFRAAVDEQDAPWAEPITAEEVEAYKDARRSTAQALVEKLPDTLMNKPEDWPATPLLYRSIPSEERREILKTIATLATQVMQDVDPVITHHTYTYDTDKPVAIMWPGCMHLGGRWTDHDYIETMLRTWPGEFFLLGDEIEGFSPSWFNDMSIIDQPLQVPLQIELFDLYMDQIWDRVRGGVWSQHGHLWFEKDRGHSPIKERYLKRNIPFFEGKANLTFVVGRQVYKIIASHDFPGTSIYNSNHKHVRALRYEYPQADVLIDGDKHFYSAQERMVYMDEFRGGMRPSPFV